MNIVYINNFAGSKKFGMELRPYYLCKNWVRSGNSVSIIASSFVHTRTTQPEVSKNFQKEVIEGIDYYWIKCPKYTGLGLIRLISFSLFILRLMLKSRFVAKNLKPEIVIASSTYLWDIFPALLISKFANAKLVYEFPDIEPLTIIQNFNYSPYHPIIWFMSLTEKFIYKISDLVVCVLPNGYAHMKKFGLPKERYMLIPNGIDVQTWEDSKMQIPEELEETISNYKKENIFLVGYAGYISKQNALETMIATADKLRNEKIHFIVIGDGPNRENLLKLKNEKKLENITFFGRIAKESVPTFLSKMDALFIAFNKLQLYEYGVNTNKLYDYMMQGKPVIQSQNAGNDLVSEGKCGISCPAEDPEAVANGILRLKGLTSEEREKIGANGRSHVLGNYTYQILSEKYLRGIEKLR